MAKSRLELIIDAVDNASGTFAKIGGVAKSVLAVGAAAAVAGVGALSVALGDSVREAMAAEEVQAQLNAVLASTKGVSGMTAESINAIAESLSEVTRFEDDAIVSGQNLLLTFTNIGADVFPAATETMLNMSQALGQDLKTSAVQLGKALNDPVAGVTALRKVGVQLTDAQEELIKKFVASGDIMSAQKVILGELETEFGGVAQAAGATLAGKLDILNNQIGNVKESVGAALLPVLSQLATDMGPKVVEFAQRFGDFLQERVIPAVMDLGAFIGAEVLPRLKDLGAFVQEQALPIFGTLATVLLVSLVPAFVAWATAAKASALATITALGPVLLPIAAIGGAVALLLAAWNNNWFGIRDTLTEVWESKLKPIFETAVRWLQENIPVAIQKASDFWHNTLVPALQAVWQFIQDNIVPIFETAVRWLQENIPVAIQAAADFWNDTLLPALTTVWEFIVTNLQPVIETIVQWLEEHIPPAIDLAKKAWEEVLKPALQLVYDIIDQKLLPIIKDVVTWLKDNIPKAITEAKKFFDELRTKLQEVKEKFDPILDVIKKIVEWLKDKLQPTIEEFKEFIGGISFPDPFAALLATIDGIIGAAAEAIRKIRELLGLTGGGQGGPAFSDVGRGRGGGGGSFGGSSVRGGDTYNVTVNTGASVGTYLADIQMARAMAF